MTEQKFTLTDPVSGKSIELPTYRGTYGVPAMDISRLYRDLDHITYDPGYLSTGSCHSAITYIDGDEGVLLYRGYPIEQLAEQSNFMEVVYLLLYGELPTPTQLEQFDSRIIYHTMINEGLKKFFEGFRYDAHPMAMMVGVVGSLAAFYHDWLDINNSKHREESAIRMIAKVATIAAAAYKNYSGLPFSYPKNSLNYCENLLHMMFSVPTENYVPDQVAARALNLLFILHADHEQNASTSTVRLVGSSGANPFACAAAGIASLWGPAHGGANEAVLGMLNEIGGPKNIEKFLARAKDKDDPSRLMGFGHRVYKNYDPRAKIIQKSCHEVLETVADSSNPLFELALRLEEIALRDEYFIKRKLYPNVDFYSGIIYQALGIPVNMFTVMFAIARTPGWMAHWLEMWNDPEMRIGRPRQLYHGAARRDYVPMKKR